MGARLQRLVQLSTNSFAYDCQMNGKRKRLIRCGVALCRRDGGGGGGGRGQLCVGCVCVCVCLCVCVCYLIAYTSTPTAPPQSAFTRFLKLIMFAPL